KATNRRRHEAHVHLLPMCATLLAIFGTALGQKLTAALKASVDEGARLFGVLRTAREEWRIVVHERGEWRSALRARMMLMVRISRVADLEAGSAELFQAPDVGSDQLLASDARMMRDRAEAVIKTLEGNGLPEGMLDYLTR